MPYLAACHEDFIDGRDRTFELGCPLW